MLPQRVASTTVQVLFDLLTQVPLFLARATAGTSLYVLLRQSVRSLVSQSVSAFLFFKTHIRVLLDHVGS